MIQNSQPSINDDGVRLDGEAKDPGVFRRVSEDDLLPLGVLFWEKADVRNTVVLKQTVNIRDKKLPFLGVFFICLRLKIFDITGLSW